MLSILPTTFLSPEIRYLIYRYLLHIPDYFVGTPSKPYQYPVTVEPAPLDLSILLVSKQTYLEAFHILYAHNTFTFNNIGTLLKFLQRIGYARRQQVVSVVFKWIGADPKAAFRLLKTCSRLKRIEFTLCYFQLKGLVALREVRGLEEVEIHHRRQLAFCVCMAVLGRGCNRNMHLDDTQLSDPIELKEAMMRPRLKQYEQKEIDLFNLKKENFRESEERSLGFWDRNGIFSRPLS